MWEYEAPPKGLQGGRYLEQRPEPQAKPGTQVTMVSRHDDPILVFRF